MFSVDALRLLVTVAGTGSFTEAATQLNYTQSAVSRRIAALERQAGGELFERLPRGVRLNPAGHALHRHAADVLDRLSKAEQELVLIRRGGGGLLRVGAISTANISLLPAALRAFTQASPAVEVTLLEGRGEALTQRVADGALDLAVISDYPAGLPSVDRVTTTALLSDELLVVLRRDHPLASAGTVDLRELRAEPWLQSDYGGRPTMLADACARAGFTPRKIIRIAEWTGKFGYVAAGLGVALVPSLAAWAVPAELTLCRLSDPTLRRTVYTALPAAPLPAALALRDLLATHASHARRQDDLPVDGAGDPEARGEGR